MEDQRYWVIDNPQKDEPSLPHPNGCQDGTGPYVLPIVDEQYGGVIGWANTPEQAERIATALALVGKLHGILSETDRPSHNRVAMAQLAFDKAGIPCPPTEHTFPDQYDTNQALADLGRVAHALADDTENDNAQGDACDIIHALEWFKRTLIADAFRPGG